MKTMEYEQFLKKNVPMIAFSGAEIIKIDPEQCIAKIPFTAENKNHVQSMYLGSLVIGGEIAAGILVFEWIKQTKLNSTVVFKDLHADFLKRALKDVYFVCQDAQTIKTHLEQAHVSGERVNFKLNIIALENVDDPDSVVAKFTVTASVKKIM